MQPPWRRQSCLAATASQARLHLAALTEGLTEHSPTSALLGPPRGHLRLRMHALMGEPPARTQHVQSLFSSSWMHKSRMKHAFSDSLRGKENDASGLGAGSLAQLRGKSLRKLTAQHCTVGRSCGWAHLGLRAAGYPADRGNLAFSIGSGPKCGLSSVDSRTDGQRESTLHRISSRCGRGGAGEGVCTCFLRSVSVQIWFG